MSVADGTQRRLFNALSDFCLWIKMTTSCQLYEDFQTLADAFQKVANSPHEWCIQTTQLVRLDSGYIERHFISTV
jgi:hypothetical protein